MFLRIGKSLSIAVIKERINLFHSGEWDILLQQLTTDLKNPFPLRRSGRKQYKGTTPIEETINAVRYEQAGKALEDGNIAKACKVIVEPSTQSPVTAESLEVLKLLHPKRLVGNDIPDNIQKNTSVNEILDMCNPQS